MATKSEMEQLFIELAAVPALIGQLSDRMDRLESGAEKNARVQAETRESQIRTEESQAAMKSRLDKINGSLSAAVACGQDNTKDLAVLKESVAQRFKTVGDTLSDLKKGVWAIALIFIGYIAQGILSRVFG